MSARAAPPLRVVVVDDSLTIRMDLAQAFSAAGFDVRVCATAAEARAEIDAGVELLLLDVLLPDGDGVELSRHARARLGEQVAIIILSSETEVPARQRGLETGADEYVGKPYDAAYLVARGRELARRRRPPGDEGEASAADAPILVIDDSKSFRERLREALAGAGYAVITAQSGEEGLRLAADQRVRAILVDSVMPGIDGATVIRRVRLDTALRATPCLLLTASEEGSAELSALDAGADAFVRKEVEIEVVLARLAALLRQAPAQATAAAGGAFGPKRILAVDDSPTYLHELAESMRGEGYDVILARSGEEALELLTLGPVDCILLDLLMPGLGGQQTCARIKAAPGLREVPLIMLTALEERDAMLAGLGAGADDYISKSAEPQVIKARVRAQLRRKQFETENRRMREELLRGELAAAEARAVRELAETRQSLIEQLERKNKELEAFSYSVSHDLRAPLRSIDGFSQAVLEDYTERLDERGRDYLRRVRAAAQRMGELIDDLLELSRVGRAELRRERVDLSAMAAQVIAELRAKQPRDDVSTVIDDRLVVDADPRLLRVALENLLGNAWKFSARAGNPRIELGRAEPGPPPVYFVRDNGAGFDMKYVDKLFRPFQRLHAASDFEGTGIGLATVQRIVDRHGGLVWAVAEAGAGATFYFTLPPPRPGVTP